MHQIAFEKIYNKRSEHFEICSSQVSSMSYRICNDKTLFQSSVSLCNIRKPVPFLKEFPKQFFLYRPLSHLQIAGGPFFEGTSLL